MEQIAELLIRFVSDYPWFAGAIGIVGTLRLLVPLIQQAVRIVVGATPSDRDDELAEKVFSSKAWNAFLAIMDWLVSTNTKKLRK